jgi:hypothetical protein
LEKSSTAFRAILEGCSSVFDILSRIPSGFGKLFRPPAAVAFFMIETVREEV